MNCFDLIASFARSLRTFGRGRSSCLHLLLAAALLSLLTGCQGVRYYRKGSCQGPGCLQGAMAQAHGQPELAIAGTPEVLAPHSRFHPVPTKPVFEPDFAVAPTRQLAPAALPAEPVPPRNAIVEEEPVLAAHEEDPAPAPAEAMGQSVLVKSTSEAAQATANVAATIVEKEPVSTASAIELPTNGWRPRGTRR